MDAKKTAPWWLSWPAVALAATLGTAQAADGGTFKVCAPPFAQPMSDRDGSGYENKIAEMFAAQLGQKTQYTWFPQRMGFVRQTLKNNDTEDGTYKCDYVMGVVENFELAATSRPYLHSTWAMVVKKGVGVDWLTAQDDLKHLDDAQRERLKIGIWDQGPTTEWIFKLGLMEQATPFPMMAGDARQSPADVVGAALDKDEVNVSFLWGPLAGYLEKKHPGTIAVIPLHTDEGIQFDFQIAMAVRYGDKERLQQLNDLIAKNQTEIDKVLTDYGVPLLELKVDDKRKDDDD